MNEKELNKWKVVFNIKVVGANRRKVANKFKKKSIYIFCNIIWHVLNKDNKLTLYIDIRRIRYHSLYRAHDEMITYFSNILSKHLQEKFEHNSVYTHE